MKRKVVKQSEALVAIDDTNDDEKIYAFWSSNDNYSIIIRSSDVGYYTTWLFADQIQEDCYGPYNTLHTMLESLLADGHEVYEFSGESEYADWIINMNNSL